jgi:hypothetical protein
MTNSDIQQPAERTPRRPLNSNFAVVGACASAAAFGAFNFAGALFWSSVSSVDFLAAGTMVAGAAGVAGIRAGAYATVGTMGITLAMLALFGIAIATGQPIEFTAPDWVRVDVRIVLSVAALWCVATLSALAFGLWADSSGRK